MDIVRRSLNEEFIGYIKDTYNKARIIKMIKNPSTLSTLAKECRGVSDSKGNLYVANFDGDAIAVTHSNIITWLCSNDFLEGVYSDYDDNYGWQDVVCWQRDGNTNKMLLSESYVIEQMPDDMRNHISDLIDVLDIPEIEFEKVQILSERELLISYNEYNGGEDF